MKLSSSKTLPLTRLVANTLCHSYSYCPYSPSWQIALNFYIRLREVSLLLMAIFRLRPLLLQRHCFFLSRSLGRWFVYFNAHRYRQNVSGYTCPHGSLSDQNIHTLRLYLLLLWTQFNSRQLALVLDDYVYITITLHTHKTIAHWNNASLIFKCNIARDWITQFSYIYCYFSLSEKD